MDLNEEVKEFEEDLVVITDHNDIRNTPMNKPGPSPSVESNNRDTRELLRDLEAAV